MELTSQYEMKLCITLQEISFYLYFYEHFFYMTREKIPIEINEYKKWVAKKKRALRKGDEIRFLGFIDDYKEIVDRNNR